MGQGFMKIDLQALAGVLQLPEGYEAVAIQQGTGYSDIVSILLESKDIPEREVGEDIPEIRPFYTVEYLPDQDYAYRKISTRIEIERRVKTPIADVLEVLRHVVEGTR
jgi:hypothetical protein